LLVNLFNPDIAAKNNGSKPCGTGVFYGVPVDF